MRSGNGAPQTTPPVAQVAVSAEVTIALADPTGVDVWSIACISGDETANVANINADLVVNAAAKTATFTAPLAGKSLIFESVVNRGVDRFGRPDPSLRSTFKVAVPTGDGYVVLATNETYEHNAEHGWTGVLNQIIRGGAGSGGGGASLPAYAEVTGAALVEGDGGGTSGGVQFRSLAPGDIKQTGNNTVLGTDGTGKAVARKVTKDDISTTGETATNKALVTNGSGGAAFRQLTANDISGLSMASVATPINVRGAVIVEDPAGTFTVRKLRSSDLAPDFGIATFTSNLTATVARGTAFTGTTFAATYSNGAPETATITKTDTGSTNGSDTDLTVSFATPFASASTTGTLKRLGTDSGSDPVVTFTLSATDTDTGVTATRTLTVTFTSHVYSGTSTASSVVGTDVYNNNALQSGFSEALSATKTQTQTITASSQYVYFIWPNASPYTSAAPTFIDLNTTFAFDTTAGATVSITRNGVTRTYAVWRSVEKLSGTFKVQVT